MLAEKIFRHGSVVGKGLLKGEKDEFIVSGVIRDMPHNSSIQFDALLPFTILVENFKARDMWKTLETNWGDYNYTTYLHLHAQAEPRKVAEQLTASRERTRKFQL
jgi:putative ABC transport system permease protein